MAVPRQARPPGWRRNSRWLVAATVLGPDLAFHGRNHEQLGPSSGPRSSEATPQGQCHSRLENYSEPCEPAETSAARCPRDRACPGGEDPDANEPADANNCENAQETVLPAPCFPTLLNTAGRKTGRASCEFL